MSRFQIEMAVAAATVALSFIASVWVQAISRLSSARAGHLMRVDEKKGSRLIQMAENPRPFLTGALLVMLAARVTAVVMVAAMMIRAGVSLAPLAAAALMTFVLFQVAEIAPRSWVLERPDQAMLFSARPVWILGRVLRPISALLVKLNRIFMLVLPGRGLPRSPLTSEEEIMSMLAVAESEEVIETGEREMIHSIFEFGDTVVREVMAPRPDMVCVDAEDDLDQVLATALRKRFSRLPVIKGSIDEVVGITHIRDVVSRARAGNGKTKARKAKDVMRAATFVPESKKVAELLREMQQAKIQMAIVVDEYGGVAGLVTMEDLLEEIVGEISDEYDPVDPVAEQVDDDTLRVSARMGIDELNERLGTKLPNSNWDSVGGLVGGLLGRVPAQGDRVPVDGVEFEVESMKGRRIEKILVHHPAEGESPAGGAAQKAGDNAG